MIAIIDYGVGNLFSLKASLAHLGADVMITDKKSDIKAADRIILPGVGAFKDAIDKLNATGLVDTICEETSKGKPLLGICLGMQLLFEKSFEYGEHEGLGLIKGNVCDIRADLSEEGKKTLKVPHIGWNALKLNKTQQPETHCCSNEISKPVSGKDPLFKYINEGDHVYFVHSYYAKDCAESTIATTEYEIPITAAVRAGSVYGTQFHPEKSGEVGMKILRAFMEL